MTYFVKWQFGLAASAVLIMLAGGGDIAAAKDFKFPESDEVKEGPGVFSGPDGAFVLTPFDYGKKEQQETAPPPYPYPYANPGYGQPPQPYPYAYGQPQLPPPGHAYPAPAVAQQPAPPAYQPPAYQPPPQAYRPPVQQPPKRKSVVSDAVTPE